MNRISTDGKKLEKGGRGGRREGAGMNTVSGARARSAASLAATSSAVSSTALGSLISSKGLLGSTVRGRLSRLVMRRRELQSRLSSCDWSSRRFIQAL